LFDAIADLLFEAEFTRLIILPMGAEVILGDEMPRVAVGVFVAHAVTELTGATIMAVTQ